MKDENRSPIPRLEPGRRGDWPPAENAPAATVAYLETASLVPMMINLHRLIDMCHGASLRAGWWHRPDGSVVNEPHQVPVKLCLIHSEISEAMEADRKGLMDDKLTHRSGIEVELADAVIRIFDLAGALDLDLPGAIFDKMFFNAGRPDHMPENRIAAGGKTY